MKKAKFKQIKTVEEKFKKAEELIRNAENGFETADHQFIKTYLLEYMKDADEQKITFLKELKEEKIKKEIKKTDSSDESPSFPSIKELIDSSFTKVKESYQVFIEMSGLVRKSL